MKQLLAFCARNYVNWSAIKLSFFIGALLGMAAQSVLIALVLAGVELVP